MDGINNLSFWDRRWMGQTTYDKCIPKGITTPTSTHTLKKIIHTHTFKHTSTHKFTHTHTHTHTHTKQHIYTSICSLNDDYLTMMLTLMIILSLFKNIPLTIRSKWSQDWSLYRNWISVCVCMCVCVFVCECVCVCVLVCLCEGVGEWVLMSSVIENIYI